MEKRCRYCETPIENGDKDFLGVVTHMCDGVRIERLVVALGLILDHVNYLKKNCSPVDMVAAAIPANILILADAIYEENKGSVYDSNEI